MRKTFNVQEFKERINERLKNSTCSAIERYGMAHLLSDILMDTGNYNGFNYLESETNIHAGIYGKDGRVFFY